MASTIAASGGGKPPADPESQADNHRHDRLLPRSCISLRSTTLCAIIQWIRPIITLGSEAGSRDVQIAPLASRAQQASPQLLILARSSAFLEATKCIVTSDNPPPISSSNQIATLGRWAAYAILAQAPVKARTGLGPFSDASR